MCLLEPYSYALNFLGSAGGLILEIDGDRTVLAWCFNGWGRVSFPCRRWWVRMRHGEVNVLKWQGYRERMKALLLNSVESGLFHTPTLDKTMIDRISRPRLFLENVITYFG